MKTGNTDGLFTRTKKAAWYWYTQYELIMCINMFEPWEKMLLNSFIAVIALMVSYSSYVYLPNYVRSLLSKSLLFIQDPPQE